MPTAKTYARSEQDFQSKSTISDLLTINMKIDPIDNVQVNGTVTTVRNENGYRSFYERNCMLCNFWGSSGLTVERYLGGDGTGVPDFRLSAGWVFQPPRRLLSARINSIDIMNDLARFRDYYEGEKRSESATIAGWKALFPDGDFSVPSWPSL